MGRRARVLFCVLFALLDVAYILPRVVHFSPLVYRDRLKHLTPSGNTSDGSAATEHLPSHRGPDDSDAGTLPSSNVDTRGATKDSVVSFRSARQVEVC